MANVVELHLRFPKRIVELIDEIVKSGSFKKRNEAILFLVCKSLEHYGYRIIPNNSKEAEG